MAKENEFYMQLINLALPPETNNHSDASERPSRGTVLPLECFFFLCHRRIYQLLVKYVVEGQGVTFVG